MTVTQENIENFIKVIQSVSNERAERSGLNPFTFGYDFLQKNVRIWHTDANGSSKSVYCFVEIASGDVLKGSWKAPVKNGKRGNIFDPNVANCLDWSGLKYLR